MSDTTLDDFVRYAHRTNSWSFAIYAFIHFDCFLYDINLENMWIACVTSEIWWEYAYFIVQFEEWDAREIRRRRRQF